MRAKMVTGEEVAITVQNVLSVEPTTLQLTPEETVEFERINDAACAAAEKLQDMMEIMLAAYAVQYGGFPVSGVTRTEDPDGTVHFLILHTGVIAPMTMSTAMRVRDNFKKWAYLHGLTQAHDMEIVFLDTEIVFVRRPEAWRPMTTN